MFCIDVGHTSDECNLKKDEEADYDKQATSDVQFDVITQSDLASQPNANKKASMSFHARNLVGASVTLNHGDLLKIFTQGGKNFVHLSGLQIAASKKRKSGKEVAAINKENE
ncbi:emp24/gp25L/p24 family/GOLD family protein [Perilla frutescens var. hirtella]|nr:emp24/gp25L/p24 family/GOLD family protein [Perilla frutescens var. hirtella]